MPVGQQVNSALWGLGIGVVCLAAIWVIVSNAWYRSATGDRVPPTDTKPTPIGMVEEYPEGLAEAHGRPPLFLKLVIASFLVWAVGYIVLFFRWGV